MVMTFNEQQGRYRRKLQRSAKLVERIAKMTYLSRNLYCPL